MVRGEYAHDGSCPNSLAVGPPQSSRYLGIRPLGHPLHTDRLAFRRRNGFSRGSTALPNASAADPCAYRRCSDHLSHASRLECDFHSVGGLLLLWALLPGPQRDREATSVGERSSGLYPRLLFCWS